MLDVDRERPDLARCADRDRLPQPTAADDPHLVRERGHGLGDPSLEHAPQDRAHQQRGQDEDEDRPEEHLRPALELLDLLRPDGPQDRDVVARRDPGVVEQTSALELVVGRHGLRAAVLHLLDGRHGVPESPLVDRRRRPVEGGRHRR
ncbi:hypothetical protein D3C74_355910 [compost metagenome]